MVGYASRPIAALERELVVNPNTGEVLRDYWELLDDEYKRYFETKRSPS